eukprot:6994522-Pyramimonas_sp.AAC.1
MTEPASATHGSSRSPPPVLGPLRGEFALESARRCGEVLNDVGAVKLGPQAPLRQPRSKRGPLGASTQLTSPRKKSP